MFPQENWYILYLFILTSNDRVLVINYTIIVKFVIINLNLSAVPFQSIHRGRFLTMLDELSVGRVQLVN